MSEKTLVSVLIPTYNRASFLKGTLESVFAQRIPVHAVLLVDDGSTDNTREVVDRLRAEHPEWGERLQYIYQENQGKSVALNKALGRVAGDWIAFDDSDDRWLPQKLEEQFSCLEQFPGCGACFTDSRFVNNPEMDFTAFQRARKSYAGKIGRIPDAPRFIVDAPHGVFMQTVVVRIDVMRQVGPFDPRLRVSQDTDFLFRLAMTTQLCYVNRPLVEIDRTVSRKDGLTTVWSRKSQDRLKDIRYMYEKWLALRRDWEPDIREMIRSHLQALNNEIANWYLVNADYPGARRALAEALRIRFAPRLAAKWALVRVAPGWVQKKVAARAANR